MVTLTINIYEILFFSYMFYNNLIILNKYYLFYLNSTNISFKRKQDSLQFYIIFCKSKQINK